MIPDAIKNLLEEKAVRYNTPGFIDDDPVQVPHRFSRRENIEISGLLTALLAWGRRDMITRSSLDLIRRMDNDPADFILHMEESDRRAFQGFCYRTFNPEDAFFLSRALQHVTLEYGGLREVFREGYRIGGSIRSAIEHFRQRMLEIPHRKRSEKHLASPGAGSAAKRLNLFLRWMVRKDAVGVDFGIWDFVPPADLCIPLDIHTGNVARKLGLLRRKQNDWKAVEELTGVLRQLDPVDPVKYDYALFGLGYYENI